MKKHISLLVVICLLLAAAFSFTACEKKEYKYTVGICQLVQHAALDAATQGFIDAINEKLPGQVNIINKNASGESVNCGTIVNGFVSQKVDLIMANATPALTAAVSATNTIPILGTSITSYAAALDLENFTDIVGGNVSGTSDLADINEQAKMIQAWFPNAKTVSLLFCSSEANSRFQVDEMTKALKALGITTKEFAFTDSNDAASVAQAACDAADVVYIPTDNTAASNIETIGNVASAANKPIVAGEEGTCRDNCVCTLTINYYDLGYTTGLMAVKILTGEADISTMPIEYAPAKPKYDADVCARLGLTPLAGYEKIEK